MFPDCGDDSDYSHSHAADQSHPYYIHLQDCSGNHSRIKHSSKNHLYKIICATRTGRQIWSIESSILCDWTHIHLHYCIRFVAFDGSGKLLESDIRFSYIVFGNSGLQPSLYFSL